MLAKGLQQLDPPPNSVVLIENVGNLVCPALFDLGERSKVVIASVTEGDDKPIKYPHMFRQSEVMILNKIDLLPYVPFSVDRCLAYARQVNPHIRVIQVSALRGDGLEEWYDWIRQQADGHTGMSAHRHSAPTDLLLLIPDCALTSASESDLPQPRRRLDRTTTNLVHREFGRTFCLG